jgi:hypothetical protein
LVPKEGETETEVWVTTGPVGAVGSKASNPGKASEKSVEKGKASEKTKKDGGKESAEKETKGKGKEVKKGAITRAKSKGALKKSVSTTDR